MKTPGQDDARTARKSQALTELPPLVYLTDIFPALRMSRKDKQKSLTKHIVAMMMGPLRLSGRGGFFISSSTNHLNIKSMTQYKFHQDELVAVWRRHTIGVSAETQEEAKNLIRENGIANTGAWEGDDCDGRIQLLEDGKFLDIQEHITVEQNAGIPTIVIQTPDGHAVADNCGNRHYLAESGLWRARAIELIKQQFEAPEEKVIEFVDGHWANDTTDEENLSGFDAWFNASTDEQQ